MIKAVNIPKYCMTIPLKRLILKRTRIYFASFFKINPHRNEFSLNVIKSFKERDEP